MIYIYYLKLNRQTDIIVTLNVNEQEISLHFITFSMQRGFGLKLA